MYSEQDAAVLEKICRFKKAGVSLKDIGEILDKGKSELFRGAGAAVFPNSIPRSAHLGSSMRFILGILQTPECYKKIGVIEQGYLGGPFEGHRVFRTRT